MEILNQIYSKIVGSTFCDGQVHIEKLTKEEELIATREPQNEFDPNAISITNKNGNKLGYIPKDTAKGISEAVDVGNTLKEFVSEVTGVGSKYVGCNIIVSIYNPGN